MQCAQRRSVCYTAKILRNGLSEHFFAEKCCAQNQLPDSLRWRSLENRLSDSPWIQLKPRLKSSLVYKTTETLQNILNNCQRRKRVVSPALIQSWSKKQDMRGSVDGKVQSMRIPLIQKMSVWWNVETIFKSSNPNIRSRTFQIIHMDETRQVIGTCNFSKDNGKEGGSRFEIARGVFNRQKAHKWPLLPPPQKITSVIFALFWFTFRGSVPCRAMQQTSLAWSMTQQES